MKYELIKTQLKTNIAPFYEHVPDKNIVLSWIHLLKKCLFSSPSKTISNIKTIEERLNNIIISSPTLYEGTYLTAKTEKFIEELPHLQKQLLEDAQFIHENDPAAHCIAEVIYSYPGFKAITYYRIAHILDNMKIKLLPRVVSSICQQETGVDIHPKAVIGNPFHIDHATGIVIGATTIIGNYVKIYQGVTLGALQVQKKLAQEKRHPTIEDNVTMYANSTILGGDTIIGKNTIIGGNVFITKSIPPNSIVYQSSELKVKVKTEPNQNFDFVI